jgi:hypothetical protein
VIIVKMEIAKMENVSVTQAGMGVLVINVLLN